MRKKEGVLQETSQRCTSAILTKKAEQESVATPKDKMDPTSHETRLQPLIAHGNDLTNAFHLVNTARKELQGSWDEANKGFAKVIDQSISVLMKEKQNHEDAKDKEIKNFQIQTLKESSDVHAEQSKVHTQESKVRTNLIHLQMKGTQDRPIGDTRLPACWHPKTFQTAVN